ncbi:sugar phosphate isomerase/epimerase family protein [Frondihabitans australicus]|uniref:Sugar phosphate isomerase/epimerase n=1 Tax=Frondihabitans australicus TaxID=386892 RepID=A0A495IM46_9MICO|nr:sugar phosphate isomerase/epimerase [Frondihabitans australicus]RKR76498.1 sugar phosphate isomerase/epimerase [Frondihabitans australicus]
MTKPLSVQLYSVRDAVAADLPGAVARLAEIGFTTVEPYGFAERPDEFASALSAAGLTAPSGHAPAIDSADAAQIFEAAKTVGIETVIDPFIPGDRWQTAAQIDETAARVNELTAQAAGYGLAFGYHNHNWELETSIDGATALEYFASKLDPAVVLEVDTYWATLGGADAAALLGRLGDRVKLIHVKDGSIAGGKEDQRPAGQGEIPIPAILAAAPSARRVIEFDQYSGDLFEALAASFAWLTENDTAAAE